jgi:pyruvate formate lyase activating enzyme
LADLRVGGFAPISTVDWPGELAATVFCQGCGWDCAYCHNPELIPARGAAELAWAEIVAFLATRSRLLAGVVFSGGEPLAQRALPEAVAEVRDRGFRVALHTNGQLPEALGAVLPLLDWVGLDVKAPSATYERITGVAGSGERAFESIAGLVASGVGYEVRTTVHPDLLGEAELAELAAELRAAGVTRWALQLFRSEGVRAGRLPAHFAPFPPDVLARVGAGFEHFEVRG